MSWILAIDLGNGGPKVAAVDVDGQILATAFQPVSVYVGRDGTATQDAIEWEAALRSAIARVTEDVSREELYAIGITGQWASTVPVGPDDAPAGPVMLWSDTRSRHNVRKLIGGPISVGGYAPHKVLPWLRITGGAPIRPAPIRPGTRYCCRTNCRKSVSAAGYCWSRWTTWPSCSPAGLRQPPHR